MTDIDAIFKEAVTAQQAGRLKEAIEAYGRVLAVEPSRFTALNNLGMTLHAAGRIREAVSYYQRVLEGKDNPLTRNNLGNALRDLGQPREAADQYRRALEFNADYVDANSNLGVVLIDMGRVSEAVPHLEKAMSLKPDASHVYSNLGNARQAQGRSGDAVDLYRKAIELNPDYAEAHSNLATALVSFGRHDEAVEHYRRAVALRPHLGGAQRQLAQLDPAAVDAAGIEKLLENPALPQNHRAEMYFALAEVARAAGDPDRAFAHYAEANRLKRQSVRFDAAVDAQYIDGLIRIFTRDFFEDRNDYGLDSEVPVFIVGFPRSGTSLVEQILASHPQVAGAGEAPFMPGISRELSQGEEPYPGNLRRIDPETVRALGRRYLERLELEVPDKAGAARITDKLPDNYQRLGLVRLLLPRARIIHCRRDPRDTCLSLFFQSFTGHHPYSWDLADIGARYRGYHRLMAHWREVIPAANLLEVRYEDLVADQETVSRRLLEFIGLEWHPLCLEFYRTDRLVTSASHAGVRRPIYREAVNRWRAYRKHLWPLVESLGPITEEWDTA